MRNKEISAREIAIAGSAAVAACVIFYIPIWSTGIKILQAVLDDMTGYLFLWGGWVQNQKEYLDGYFPLWVDVSESASAIHVWGGALFYPLHLLALPFDYFRISDVLIISHVWLMAVFGYIFSRRSLRLGPAGAAMAAIAFAFSGHSQKGLQNLEMNVTWTIPAFMLVLTETLTKRSFRWMIGCGIIAAIALFGGHPISAFFVFMMAGLWALYLFLTREINLDSAPLLIGAAVSGLFISAIQFIPGIECLFWYWSYHFDRPMTGSLPLEGFFSLALPWLVGTYKTNFAVSQLAPYLGAIPLLFLVIALVYLRRLDKKISFFAIFTVVFFGAFYNIPPFSFIGYIPPFNRVMMSISIYPCMTFAAAILSGAALDFLMGNPDARSKLLKWTGGAIAATIALGGYAFVLIKRFSGSSETSVFFQNPIAAFDAFGSQLVFGVGIFIAAGATAYFLPKRKAFAVLSIVSIAYFGLLVDALGWNYENIGYAERLFRSNAVKYLQSNMRKSDTMAVQCDFMRPNIYMVAGLKSIQIVAPIQPERYIRLLARLYNLEPDIRPEDAPKFEAIFSRYSCFPIPMNRFGTPVSDLLGIRFAAVGEFPLPQNGELVYASDAAIYESKTVLPSAFLSANWKIKADRTELFDTMMNMKRGDEKIALLLAGDPGVDPADMPERHEGDAGDAFEKSWRSQKIVYDIAPKSDAILIMRGLYHPGWRCWVDGIETRVFHADYIWRAALVKRGNREAVFMFAPHSFAIALWSFIATTSLLLYFSVIRIIKKIRQ